MKIVDVRWRRIRSRLRIQTDSEGKVHPGPVRETAATLMTVVTDEGAEGHYFGASPEVIERTLRPLLVGEDPFEREKLWHKLEGRQRSNGGPLTDGVLASADMALWDLAGRVTGLPVHKLLGGYRTKVRAYASTYVGDPDEVEGGLNSPEAYAAFALTCKARGYTAFKIHTRMPPIPGTPNPKEDVAICRAVREAVGPEMALMLDPFHRYTREEALYIGREIEKLNYAWLEEPMDEHNTSSYVWLAERLTIPILGPEHAEGKVYTRAEWIKQKAADILRAGTWDVGGITPVMKIAHLCEAFGMPLELHGPGIGNLQALCAMSIPGAYIERGLLHPFLDYEEPLPFLNSIDDPMDNEGFVHVSDRPGLGQDINWDYVRENTLASG